jgi:hypothetical protein
VPAAGEVTVIVPVAAEQVGCCVTLATGAAGNAGDSLITKSEEGNEVQDNEFVTVKLNMPDGNPVIVVLVPEPVTAPGLIVQLSEGKPLKTTLPEGTPHVGWVIVPIIGAAGRALTVSVAVLEVTLVTPLQLVM